MPDDAQLPDSGLPPLAGDEGQKSLPNRIAGSPPFNVAPGDIPALDPTEAIVSAIGEGLTAAVEVAGSAAEVASSAAGSAAEVASTAASGMFDGCAGCGCSAVVMIGMVLTAGAAAATTFLR